VRGFLEIVTIVISKTKDTVQIVRDFAVGPFDGAIEFNETAQLLDHETGSTSAIIQWSPVVANRSPGRGAPTVDRANRIVGAIGGALDRL
jgi:hypothetical protein